jgi:hypothetical protein
MPKIISICFGGDGPDRADVEEHGDHHGAGGEDLRNQLLDGQTPACHPPDLRRVL